jgi:hypothetical protein
MAKKQIISDALQKKFNKPQFQIGDAVFFSWLGQKQYGHVKQLKQNSWGIQYTVESSSKVKYPCGIQIQGQKTAYNVGFIFFEDTVSIGPDELERRIQTAPKRRTVTTISIDTSRSTNESRVSGQDGNADDGNHNAEDTKVRTKRSTKSNAVSSGSDRTGRNNTTKRKTAKNVELDAAIAKQRSFLDFTKPIKKD